MIGSTVSLAFFLFAALIACTLATEQIEGRLFEPGQFVNADYDLFNPFEGVAEPSKRVPAYTSPFVRFGKRGGMSRSLRNGYSMEPLIRFGKRATGDKRFNGPFVRFGRSFRQSAPHIRFGK